MLRRPGFQVAFLTLMLAVLDQSIARAAWIWDVNQDKIDDRMLAVETQGIDRGASGQHAGGQARLRGDELRRAVSGTACTSVTTTIRPMTTPPRSRRAESPSRCGTESIDYIRSVITYAQAQQIAQLPASAGSRPFPSSTR